MWFVFRLVLAALRMTARSRQDLVLENVALRHQLGIYRRSRPATLVHAGTLVEPRRRLRP